MSDDTRAYPSGGCWWIDPEKCGTVYGGKRTPKDFRDRAQGIAALLGGSTALYAMRAQDGAIKFGYTSNLPNRISGLHGILLAMRPGGREEERAIHDALKPHRKYGREYYHPVPEVLAVVNQMRDDYGLPHL